MLFENKLLLSKYDFGQKQIKNMSIEDLCQEIYLKSRKIYALLEEGNDVYLHHTDNKGNAVIISHEKYEEFYKAAFRTKTEIKDMIERSGDNDDPSHSTIAKGLYKLGIYKTKQEGYEYAGYLRLLYFFI